MGKIKKILENELVGGTQSTDVYPVTSTKAVYNSSNESLDKILHDVSNIINVDTVAPISQGFYTSTKARDAVPNSYRVIGLIITYKTDAKTSVTEQFIGTNISNWSVDDNWVKIGSDAGGNKILTWSVDTATTRKQVLPSYRKYGLQITYKNSEGETVNEQYISNSFTDKDWISDVNWQRIPNEKQIKELDTKVESNSIVVDSIVGGDKNIKSVYDLKYTNVDAPLTVLEGYASEEYTGTVAFKSFSTHINVGSGFPTNGTYHVYGKFEVHVEGDNVSNLKNVVTNAVIIANAVIEPAITEFPINKLKTVYLGKITFTGKLTNYFYLLNSNIKDLQGNNVGGTYTVSYRYYGGYLVDATTLGTTDPNDLVDKLDYTKDETIINLPGTNSKVNADLKSLHAEDAAIKEDVEGIRSNVESLNTLTVVVKSVVDVRKDKFAVDTSSTDEGDFIRKPLSAPYYSGKIAVKEYFVSTKDKYSCFAKVKISTEDSYDTSDKFASVFVSRNNNESSNYKVYNVPLNKLTGVYLGDIDDPGTVSYFYINVSGIRDVNNNPVTNLGAITWDLYGAYYVKELEVSGIKEHIADYIDYSKLETPVIVNSVYSNKSEQADKAKQADFAASSELANNINNIFRGIQLKVYGDSLVVFIAWDNLKKMLSIKGSVMEGIGGIEVRNNSTSINYGLCSLEKIATFPRNMKLLVIYGGANDGVSTKWAEATPDHPMTVDISKLGTISDEPLKIADMLNYRVTKENISNTNTLGRAQTFYQGYKTMLRNVMALFPNCFILCVTQHKYYYYDKPTGGFSDTPVIRMGAYEKVKAIREIAEEYSVPVCDLWATSGVNDHNRRYTLIDAAGVLVHQTTATALREESLILNKILEIAPRFEIPNYSIRKGEDIIEMKKWVVDVRDETECNVMTLEEAITAFNQKVSSDNIELKNNMLLPFYYNTNFSSKVYILKDYTQPTATASWEEWVGSKIVDPNVPT